MVEALRDPGFGRRVLAAALVCGWTLGVGLRVLLWVAAGVFPVLGALGAWGFWTPPRTPDCYQLSLGAGALAVLVHLVMESGPFSRHGRDA